MTEPTLAGEEALALLPLLAAGDLEPAEAARLRAAVAADPGLASEAARLESVHTLLARTLGKAASPAPAAESSAPPPLEGDLPAADPDVAFGRFLVLKEKLTGEQVREAYRQLQAYRVEYPQLNLAQVLARHGLCDKDTLLTAHQAFMARSAPPVEVVGSPVEEPVDAPTKTKAKLELRVLGPTSDAPRPERRDPARRGRGSRPLLAGLGVVLTLGASGAAVALASRHAREQRLEELAASAERERLDLELASAKLRQASLALLATLSGARDLDERLAIASRAVEADRTCSDALVARARARYALARSRAPGPTPRPTLTSEALADLDEAIRREPARPLAYVVKGELLLEWPEPKARQQADEALRAARSRDPGGPLDALADGLLLAGAGQLEAAVAAYTRALAQSPTLVDAYLARARARLKRREFGKALEDASQAVRQDPWSADALALQAEARYFASGASDRAGALRTLAAALVLDPDDAHTLAVRAYARLERDRFGDLVSGPEDRAASRRDAERALALFAEEPLAHLTLAELTADTNAVEAKQHASRAIECGRHLVQTWLLRGRLRGREGDEYAMGDFDEVLKLAPTNVHALTNKGAVLFVARRDAEQAMVLLDRAIRVDPDMPWAYYWRGKIFLAPPRSAQKYARAVTEFSEAITRQPRFPDAYFQRACAYHDMGRYHDCLEDLAQAEAQRGQGGSSASQGVFLQHYVELVRGHALFFSRQYPEATAAYERYRDTAPPGEKAMPGVVRRLEELRRLDVGEVTPEQLSGE